MSNLTVYFIKLSEISFIFFFSFHNILFEDKQYIFSQNSKLSEENMTKIMKIKDQTQSFYFPLHFPQEKQPNFD